MSTKVKKYFFHNPSEALIYDVLMTINVNDLFSLNVQTFVH